jgi:prepilin-type N-terminal cleavage/methylation domain-containing protein
VIVQNPIDEFHFCNLNPLNIPMKTPTKRSSASGFTLIELLVVIAIIAVLAAAGFAAGTAAMEKARKVTAQAAATSITQAVEQFYVEYSALPDPTGNASTDTEYTTVAGNGTTLLEILGGVGTKTVVTDQNPRKIRFLSYKEAKNERDGIKYGSGGTSIDAMYDPWGQPFYVRLDFDYDERITVSPSGSPSVTLNGKKVAVYSLGVRNPTDSKASKLVRSW